MDSLAEYYYHCSQHLYMNDPAVACFDQVYMRPESNCIDHMVAFGVPYLTIDFIDLDLVWLFLFCIVDKTGFPLVYLFRAILAIHLLVYFFFLYSIRSRCFIHFYECCFCLIIFLNFCSYDSSHLMLFSCHRFLDLSSSLIQSCFHQSISNFRLWPVAFLLIRSTISWSIPFRDSSC